jgi:hypothetical protein
MNIIATGGNTIKTLVDALERVLAVATTEKLRKKIITVQIVHHHLTLIIIIIIKTSLADALEHNTAVAPTKKPQKMTKKELTVALGQNTVVVMTEYQPNHVQAERLLC